MIDVSVVSTTSNHLNMYMFGAFEQKYVKDRLQLVPTLPMSENIKVTKIKTFGKI